jgi:Zn-dependent protease
MIETLISSPLSFVISLLAIAAAITIHEFAHAWAADRLGDPTPRMQGRLTLNPLAHLDPLGTLMLVLFRFGWGKPVQFDQFNLKNPRRDAMLISIAGPVSNLLTATLAAILLRFLPSNLLTFLTLQPFIVISVVLAVFNFVPVHPLDGGKILSGILPLSLAKEWEQIQAQFGTILLIMMVLPWGGTAPIFYLTGPIVQFILNILLGLRPAV